MTQSELDAWLENWSRWLRDDGDCYPQAAPLASVEADYRCPQRWHHGTEAPQPSPIYPIAAQRVETAVHDPTFPATWRSAVIATWVRWPAARLTAARINADLWPQKRAAAAAQSVRTYQDSLSAAKSRLTRILAPHAALLP